jgi:regulator of nucleoside diphosphate kinase
MSAALAAVLEERGNIHIGTSTCARLQDLIEGYRAQGVAEQLSLDRLEEELDRATLVPDDKLAPDIVTVGSRVRLVDVNMGEERRFTLVLPSRANVDEGRVSILAPLGMAVLGYRALDEVAWDLPGGRRLLRLEEVVPPESRR